jgi:acyl dehydratase
MPADPPAPDGPDARRLQGLWFEEFAPGFAIQAPRRTLTEADIVAFAGLSGDFNPLHVDEPAARRTAFRGRIAHGLLVQSVASGLINQTGAFHGTIAALQEMSIRYLAPVRAGDTIAVELRVREVEPDPGPKRGWVLFDALITNHQGATVIEGHWRTLVLRRPRDRGPAAS